MFTDYTFQDWLAAGEDKRDMIMRVVQRFKQSPEFSAGLEAMAYFRSENPTIARKTVTKAHTTSVTDERGKTTTKPLIVNEISGSRVPNGFFSRFIIQENQHLLANGVVLDDAAKEKLGAGFDKTLEKMGEKALIQGVCWGYWNVDHLEVLQAAIDKASGCCVLLDEMTGVPMVALQFWRLSAKKPMWVRVFETDGVTVYAEDKDKRLQVQQPKRAYKLTVSIDAAGAQVIGAENYDALPVFPLYANEEHTTELSQSIKQKIDVYDRILSDFADNLDRANDVYWVLNNFGGSLPQIAETMAYINQLKMVVNRTDGMGGNASAEPRTVEVPYAARETALSLLKKALYEDAMALDLDSITGGSLTNVAIKAATANLNMKCDRYEWQVFDFVQSLLRLNGIETEEIRFNRQSIANESETIQNIYMMRQDIDRRTALELNPYIIPEQIDGIMDAVDAEEIGLDSTEKLVQEVSDFGENG